ncbi:MAG: NAD(P)H-binding protein [Vicinamibacterales bacterium]
MLFGATGLAGSGVLRACLAAPAVSEVRALVRRSTAVSEPKLREIVHTDYLNYEAVKDAFAGVDACFFCLGISVTQVPNEADYRRIHQRFPLAAARLLRSTSPAAHFHYLSGGRAGLNSWWMWARVKAEAERDLMTGFEATCWRPAMIDGTPVAPMPKLAELMRPVLRAVFSRFRSMYIVSDDIGRAMLQATEKNLRGRIFENAEIRDLADAAGRIA